MKRRLVALEFLQHQHGEIETEYQKELLALEKKYFNMQSPLYERVSFTFEFENRINLQQRNDIVAGTSEPTEAEVSSLEEEFAQKLAVNGLKDLVVAKPTVTGVPGFWLTALKNHPLIEQITTPEDEKALEHLQKIKMRMIDDNGGFSFEFVFSENEFFTNKTLTKTYYMVQEEGSFVFDRAEGYGRFFHSFAL